MKKIVFVAGDKSGDFYAGLITQKLTELYKDKLKIYSFGGRSLAKSSSQILNLVEHSVSGIFEVALKIRRLLSIFRITLKKIKTINPDLVVLVDFPDFNLRLARKLYPEYKVVYYISPQIWAWRKRRIKMIKKYVDTMVVIFKFEQEFYRKEGINVLYFGHPLLDIIKQKQVNPQKRILFLPGSRRNEIQKHLPVMVEAKKIMERELKDYHYAIIRAENIPHQFYEKIVRGKLDLIEHSYQVLSEAEFAITSSGTASLELAIIGVPSLIMYKVNFLTWLILKNMVDVEFIGMPNIVVGKKVVEEFIQKEATPENIANYVLKVIKDKEIYSSLKQQLKSIKEKLSPPYAIENTAKFIGNYLNLSKNL